jgi:hypothetical protein
MEEGMMIGTDSKSPTTESAVALIARPGRLRRVVMATAFIAAGVLTLGATGTQAQAQYYNPYYAYYPYYYQTYAYYPYQQPYYYAPYARVGWGWGRGWGWGWHGGWHGGWHR